MRKSNAASLELNGQGWGQESELSQDWRLEPGNQGFGHEQSLGAGGQEHNPVDGSRAQCPMAGLGIGRKGAGIDIPWSGKLFCLGLVKS